MDKQGSLSRQYLPPTVESGGLSERRRQWRYDILMHGNFSCDSWRGNVLITNISAGGARLDLQGTAPQWNVDMPCTLEASNLSPRPARIVAHSERTVRLVFQPQAQLQADLIHQLRRTSALVMIEEAMESHENYTRMVLSALSGTLYLRLADLPDMHSCLFAQWCDTAARGPIASCPSFNTVLEAHAQFHHHGRQAILSLQNGMLAQAKNAAENMRFATRKCISLLSKLRMEILICFADTDLHPSLRPNPFDRCS